MYPNIAISFTTEEYKGVIVTYMRILDRFAWSCTIGANAYGDFIVLAPQRPDRIEPQECIAAAHIVAQACHASIDAILGRENGSGGFNDGKGGGDPEPKPTPSPTGGDGEEVEQPILSPFCMAVAGGVVALPN